MSSFLPEGYAARAVTHEDAEVVARVMSALDEHFATDERVTAADVRSAWHDVGDAGRALLVTDASGEPAGYVEISRRAGVANLDGYVLPSHFRRGLGRAFAALGEEWARAHALPEVVTGTLGADARATHLFEELGWEQVRAFLRMAVDLHGHERAPAPPPGLVLRTLTRDDGARFHAAKESAFADHWSFRPEAFDEFRRRTIDAEEFDPTLWWLVEDGDEVAAVMRCTAKRFGSGWVDSLGVRPPWRRRGLGEVLLRTAFAEFARRGERRVGLGVDAANTTGATRLYDRVGMHVVFHANVFRKVLA